MHEIKTINYGNVNCYLIKVGSGFILVDTGLPTKRSSLEQVLENAGCREGNLKLILVTHGDYDHAGNAAYFRKKYGAKIAMHFDDAKRVERGDWKWGLKAKPDKFPLIFRIMSLFIRPGQFDTFRPDIYIEDGRSLSEYGCEAQVLHLPGHTRGSIGILTADGKLICGDLLDNMRKPGLQFFIDDMASARVSIEKLMKLNIKNVYPGHGNPFLMEAFTKYYRKQEE